MWQNGADWEWIVSCRMGVCSNKKLRIDNNNSGSYHGRQQRSNNPRVIRKARLLLRSLCPIHRGSGHAASDNTRERCSAEGLGASGSEIDSPSTYQRAGENRNMPGRHTLNCCPGDNSLLPGNASDDKINKSPCGRSLAAARRRSGIASSSTSSSTSSSNNNSISNSSGRGASCNKMPQAIAHSNPEAPSTGSVAGVAEPVRSPLDASARDCVDRMRKAMVGEHIGHGQSPATLVAGDCHGHSTFTCTNCGLAPPQFIGGWGGGGGGESHAVEFS